MMSQAVVASRLEQVDINRRCQVIQELKTIHMQDTKIFTPRYLNLAILHCNLSVILTKPFSNSVFHQMDLTHITWSTPPPYSQQVS